MGKETNPFSDGEDDGGTAEVGLALPALPPQTSGLGVSNEDPRSGLPKGMGIELMDGDELRAKVDTRTGLLSNGLPTLDPSQFPRMKVTPLSEGRRHRDGSVTFGPAETTELRYECPGCGDVAHDHGARRAQQVRAEAVKARARSSGKAATGILSVDQAAS